MALTDKECKAAQPGPKSRKLTDGSGLYLEVTPSGGKYWKLKYRYLGKEKKLTIGPYPIISLQEARFKREDARRQLIDGIDPGQIKLEKKRQRLFDAQNTFKAVAESWQDHNALKWSENHARTVRRRLEQDVYPELGRKPLADIKPPDIIHMVKKIEDREAYEMARRALQYVRQVYDYGICHAIVDRNPVTHMRGILKTAPKENFAAIDIRQLPELVGKLNRNEARLFPQTLYAMKLLMLTFVRTSELIKARWEEFDLENAMWVIPAARMKTRRDHLVPLSGTALSILRDLKRLNGHRPYVFPSKTDPRNHMSNNTILAALRRMGYSGIMTGHGFRALAMTAIVERLGYPDHIPDRQLAHARKNQVMAAYNRAEFLDQRRRMMQDWADYLDTIERGGTVIAGKFGTGS
ncbi:MAG: DUF4102 domain-containing protein [Alphaproteobacteria bacterium]|nr:DUF4102 domain-containing protein [Alphaproteobacteria bacterium]